jgi:hypothetical protein
MRRVWLAVAAFALTVAACGSEEPSRFDLVTPEANTGAPREPTPEPTPVPKTTPTPEPTAPKRKPVTKTERAVIKGWADELRHGRVTAATRYFAVPTLVSNGDPDWIPLTSRADVKKFNRTLPCGAKLIRTRRSTDDFVVGVFRLTERPGAGECGTGTGETAAVAFLIEKKHITRWVRVPDDPTTPTPSPTATPSATATPTATDTPTPTPTPSGTPTPTATAPTSA